jgi:SAM-dependent methyltransferase
MSEAPSPWIVRFAPLVASGACVLDLACGHGRHARYFASRGARVVAVDRDAAALATLRDAPGIETHAVDLETGGWPFATERFDAIVAVRYLHRSLFPHLLASLATDGVVLYETFAAGNAAYGKPSNPDFLLAPGELLELRAAGSVSSLSSRALSEATLLRDPAHRAVGLARWPRSCCGEPASRVGGLRAGAARTSGTALPGGLR